jgi:hypothetical protein
MVTSSEMKLDSYMDISTKLHDNNKSVVGSLFNDLEKALAISLIISKKLVKLQLEFPKIIYKTQSHLVRNQCGT